MKSIILYRLHFKEITKEYNVAARNLLLDGLLERFGFIDHTYNPDLIDITQTYRIEVNVFLIGFLGNKLVCTGAVTKENENTGRIERMSVKKRYRRNGIANRMITELEVKAKGMGYKQNVLETNNDWKSAIEFYQRNGYKKYNNDGECTHFIKELV